MSVLKTLITVTATLNASTIQVDLTANVLMGFPVTVPLALTSMSVTLKATIVTKTLAVPTTLVRLFVSVIMVIQVMVASVLMWMSVSLVTIIVTQMPVALIQKEVSTVIVTLVMQVTV